MKYLPLVILFLFSSCQDDAFFSTPSPAPSLAQLGPSTTTNALELGQESSPKGEVKPTIDPETIQLAQEICIDAQKITEQNDEKIKCVDGKILVCHFPAGRAEASHVLNVAPAAFFLPGGGLNRHGNYVLDCNKVNYDASKNYQEMDEQTPCLCSVLIK